jgi:hypothetical protein
MLQLVHQPGVSFKALDTILDEKFGETFTVWWKRGEERFDEIVLVIRALRDIQKTESQT